MYQTFLKRTLKKWLRREILLRVFCHNNNRKKSFSISFKKPTQTSVARINIPSLCSEWLPSPHVLIPRLDADELPALWLGSRSLPLLQLSPKPRWFLGSQAPSCSWARSCTINVHSLFNPCSGGSCQPLPGLTLSLSPIMYVCAQLLSRVRLFAAPRAVSHQAPLSMQLSRQERWRGLPFPTPGDCPRDGIPSLEFAALAGGFSSATLEARIPPILSLPFMVSSMPTQSALLETRPPHSRGHKIMSVPLQKCLQNLTPPFSTTLVEIPMASHPASDDDNNLFGHHPSSTSSFHHYQD